MNLSRWMLFLSTLVSSTAAAEGQVRRFALYAASNDGGPDRIPLRYATTDAHAVATVLERLGGVTSGNAELLMKPDRASLLEALDRLRRNVASGLGSGGRSEVVIYYSGHSDEQGLLLGTERLGYAELREAIGRIPSDVRVAILDSCASGALLRVKGGQRVPAFMVDESTAVRGHAFLTASSADESAQESERIKGSYFTQSLLTGLRGAADTNIDGKVTLNEAYQYAFQETLERTTATSAGPQHPAYDIQLAGSGDLVMTDLRATSAGLVLPRELEGRVTLRDENGRLLAELRKTAGRPIELGLEPGKLVVSVESNRLYRSEVVLTEGSRVELDIGRLAPVPTEVVARRGNVVGTSSISVVDEEAPIRVVPYSFSLLPDITTDGEVDRTRAHFAFNLVAGRHAQLTGVEIGLALNLESEFVEGVQLAVGANLVDGDVTGVQVSAGANIHRGSLWGVAVTSGLNLTGGELWGAQVSAAANAVRGPMYGAQVSSIVNVATMAEGAQVSAGGNIATELIGAQVAGGLNIAGSVVGAQVAPLNIARSASVQVGVVNIGTESTEARLGVVNVGGRGPFSFGLINVAEQTDVPIGLINVMTREGYLRPTVWASDVLPISTGLKMGGRYTYSLLGVGVRPDKSAPVRWGPMAGMGIHGMLGDHFFLDTDLVATGLISGVEETHATVISSIRVQLGWQIADRLALVVGPALHVQVRWVDDDTLDVPSLAAVTWQNKDANVRVFPGLMIGLQI